MHPQMQLTSLCSQAFFMFSVLYSGYSCKHVLLFIPRVRAFYRDHGDGRQRNSHPIQVVFRDFLGTEMKMYRVAIAQAEWRHRWEGIVGRA